MSLESDVAAVLRKNPAPRIAYSLDGLTVDKGQMESVAKAIEKGDVAVKIASAGKLLGAAYSSYKGRREEPGQKKVIGEIALPDAAIVNRPIGRAGIFHESVHALVDVKSLTISKHNGDEALAYIADALYLKAVNAKPGFDDPRDKAIYDAAFDIIDGHKMLTRRTALKWSDCDDLLKAINANPAYSG